jgi:hypothetical protein
MKVRSSARNKKKLVWSTVGVAVGGAILLTLLTIVFWHTITLDKTTDGKLVNLEIIDVPLAVTASGECEYPSLRSCGESFGVKVRLKNESPDTVSQDFNNGCNGPKLYARNPSDGMEEALTYELECTMALTTVSVEPGSEEVRTVSVYNNMLYDGENEVYAVWLGYESAPVVVHVNKD